MAKSKIVKANEKVADAVVGTYKKSRVLLLAATPRSQTNLWTAT